MAMFKMLLYLLAILTSITCTVLLVRRYIRTRFRLLLWSGLCFVGLALGNVALFVDLVVFPSIDLRVLRLSATLGGLLCLLYGFIYESE